MASPVTIQPSTADTYIDVGVPTTNYGAGETLLISPYTTGKRRALLTFDFSAVVPAGATITLATLSLYTTTEQASRTITVYRLLRTTWGEALATWDKYTTANWGTAGALNTTTDITTTNAATAASVAFNNWLNVTVTAQVQTARDSVAGIAHFLVADVGASASGGNRYASSEYTTDTTKRPKLYIEFTVPFTGPKVNIGGTWKTSTAMWVNIGGTWKSVVSVKVNIGGTWKDLA